MNYKISFLRSKLHDNYDLDEFNKKFLDEISLHLGEKLIPSELSDYDCDLKLIFIESGGSEGLFLNHIKELKEPYYLLTSGSNNSLAASLEILTYLNLENKQGEVIHGSTTYISSRIKDLALINKVKSKLMKTRLGCIGKPSDWLISSIPDNTKLYEKLGVNIINIDIQELIDQFHNDLKENYVLPEKFDFDKESLRLAEAMHLSICKIKNKYCLDGLTIRCFDLLGTCNTTSCLSFSLLNKDNTIATCEGDIMSMISMTILKLLLNQSSFQANPSRIDILNNEMILAHCTIPLDMVDSYKLRTHFESGIGVAIKGELKLSDITMFRISSDLKHYFVAEGKIIENLSEENLCRTQIKVKFNDSIESLLKNPCGNHHIIVYGHHKELIKKLMKSFNIVEY